jgi:hypothetical protein
VTSLGAELRGVLTVRTHRPSAADGRVRRVRTLILNQRHAAAVLAEYAEHYDSHRPHRALGQAVPLRPLPQRTTSDTNTVQRRDRLGGLLQEYQQVA